MEEKNKPKCLILSGVSASGKTSVANVLKSKHGFHQPTQFTTRPQRTDSELDDYVFLNKAQYFAKLANGDFANFQLYNSHFYAIGKTFPQSNFLIIVDNIGKAQLERELRKQGVEHHSIFFDISKEVMKNRLINFRKSHVAEIEKRLSDFEYIKSEGYDIVLDGNRDIDTVVMKVEEALKAWHFIQ